MKMYFSSEEDLGTKIAAAIKATIINNTTAPKLNPSTVKSVAICKWMYTGDKSIPHK